MAIAWRRVTQNATLAAGHRKGHPTMGVIDRASTRVRRFLCGLHGHDALLHFEQGRLSLVCASCGYQTPGWDLTSAALRAPQSARPPRRLVRLPLVGERRVA
jgi:hypothetical protein